MLGPKITRLGQASALLHHVPQSIPLQLCFSDASVASSSTECVLCSVLSRRWFYIALICLFLSMLFGSLSRKASSWAEIELKALEPDIIADLSGHRHSVLVLLCIENPWGPRHDLFVVILALSM
ncbi:hypothetical protein GGI43DRAFT_168568 [Trichoderma evansii]